MIQFTKLLYYLFNKRTLKYWSGTVKIVVLLLMIVLISGCAGLKDAFVVPDQKEPIAINDKYTAFSIVAKILDDNSIKIQSFDYGNGEIKTNWIMYSSGIATSARTKIVFRYDSERKLLHMSGTETEEEVVNENGQNYFKRDKFLKDFSAPRVINPLRDIIDTCKMIDSCVVASDNYFSTNFMYNYLLLKSLTEVGRAKFIEEKFKGKEYSFTLPLVDFVFNKDSQYPQKYIALFSVFARENNDSSIIGNNIYIRFYTDNEEYSNNVKQQHVKAIGKLIDIDKSYINDSFNFTIEDSKK